MACVLPKVGQAVVCRSRRGVAPVKAAGGRALTVCVRAEASTTTAAKSPVPVPVWIRDNETIRDVFAFSGSAPERVNGRVAMIAFVSILGPEISKKQAVAEQMGDAWFSVIFFSLAITLASVLPKLVSGVSLKELHEKATSANLSNLQGAGGAGQLLGLFDQNTELWSGRLAMIGFSSLLLIEAIKGESFF